MKQRTIKRNKYKSSALERSASSWIGAKKILSLVSRADCENVSSVVVNDVAVDILSIKYGNF